MRFFKATCLFILSLTNIFAVHANEESVHYEVFFSKQLNEERRILVKLPKDYFSNTEKTYPVIYLPGSKDDLSLLTGLLRRLVEQKAAPEVIIAVIENTDRTRDLTPTVNQDPRGPVGQGGGGDKYLNFVEMELIPRMDKTYRTHDYRIFSGSSIGGLLAIHALHSRPHLFQAHLAFSPAVWWGARTTVQEAKEFISKTKHFDNYLYMNIGEEGGEMREVYDDFHSFLQNNKPSDLKLVTDVFPNVAHALTTPAGLFNAYHSLFLPMQMPMSAYIGNPTSIDLYYKRLSSQWGIVTIPPEANVRQIGYNLINQKKFESAIEVFKHNIKLHPDSADAQYGLAYGYEMNGNLQAALKQANIALEVVDKEHPYFGFFVNAQARLSSEVAKPK